LLNAAKDLSVIEIAHSESHHARRIFVALFHEYEHGPAGAAGPAARSGRATSSETTRATATTTTTTTTASAAR
jgi:hypothetical protein